MKHTWYTLTIGFIAGLAGAFTFQFFSSSTSTEVVQVVETEAAHYANYRSPHLESTDNRELPPPPRDFTEASAKATPSVVYIKSVRENYNSRSMYDWFFNGGGSTQEVSSGSGVIYTSDGYIITNNHVIENALGVEVIFNRRTYPAKVVGSDPSTDLAVLKIDGERLPAIDISRSSDLQVGEWVLAVGNPFNLNSTVTAGIVSAKGREINILKGAFPIESFIQTDAAINPGNSGGALVNQYGSLVGINTAILSRTGSYAGYGFAVPVDIVKKVVDDLIRYGEVQKAFFGGEVIDLEPQLADQMNMEEVRGVMLHYLQTNGAAEEAGLAKGDIIVKIEKVEINTRAEFDEQLSYFSPGDNINVVFSREGKLFETNLELRNREGGTEFLKREVFSSAELGAQFERVPQVERDLLQIQHGVRVNRVTDGLIRRLNLEEGFIITYVNSKAMDEPQDVVEALSAARGRVIIKGVNKRGVKGYYSYYF
ncbi:MAG TPA: serine protease [Cytophagales bacterium]|nr:serine protease [Cytophagales bacterium]HAA17315.1 serine protease [Cytophagales bacterium]HAP62977.1 serine protease [Cytophagales bacterium]